MTSHFYWVGRDPGDGVRRRLHDAVLLRLARALACPSTSSCASTRRPAAFNAVTFAVMTVFSSGISMYALGKLLAAAARLELPRQRRASRPSIVLVYIFARRAHQRDLQRGAAVLPDRVRVRAAGAARPARRRRLGGLSRSCTGLHETDFRAGAWTTPGAHLGSGRTRWASSGSAS